MDSFVSVTLGSLLTVGAIGGAWAGITRRYGLAILLFAIPVVIVVLIWFVWAVEA
jgi:hypothetical protein